jgi:hypothetical protein
MVADYELTLRCFGDKSLRFVYFPLLIAVYDDAVGQSKQRRDGSFGANKRHIVKECVSAPMYLVYRIIRLVKYVVDVPGV